MTRRPGAVVVGRRNCTRCGRWRHAFDFRPNARDENGEALALNYQCNSCRNAQQKVYASDPKVKRRDAKTKRAWQRQKITKHNSTGKHPTTAGATGNRGAVPRVPIATLLYDKLDHMTMSELARRLQVNEKRIYAVVYGYYRRDPRRRRGGRRSAKLAPVDFIDLGTVDRWLQLLDEPADTLERLYPLDEG